MRASEPILPQDSYGTLARTARGAAPRELLQAALTEPLEFTEQAEDGVTYAEKIGPADRLLDPDRPAVELERDRARAHAAHRRARGARRRRRAARRRSRRALSDGRADRLGPGLVADDGRLLLGTATVALELLEVQPPGGRAMDGRRLPARSRRCQGGCRRPRWAARAMPSAQARAGLAAGPRRRGSGSTPAHTGERVVGLVVDRRAVRTFAEASSIGSATTQSPHELVDSVGRRASRQRPGVDVFDDRLERGELLGALLDRSRLAEDHRRAVVGAVVASTERASTRPSISVTVRQAGVPRRRSAASSGSPPSRDSRRGRRCGRAGWGSRTAARRHRRCRGARRAPRRGSRRSPRGHSRRVRGAPQADAL